MTTGKITHLLKDGRGFIESHEGIEIGFHRDDLEDQDFEQLEIGHAVEFVHDTEGHPLENRAVQVRALRRAV